MVPESFWLTKALLFELDWIIRDSQNPNFTKADYPEEFPVAALKHCLKLLRSYEVRTAVTSNRDQKTVVGELVRLNLAEDFDNIRCFEDVTELKPKTELHLLSMDMLGVKPLRTVAFETTVDGVKAAQAAGIFCVGMPPGVDGQADMTMVSFLGEPLLHVLEKIDKSKRIKFGIV
ncbi:MAG TPA: HAD hydrolase-like protein [bacterium]|nr:HAD hydrolase-like protein [bacterium]